MSTQRLRRVRPLRDRVGARRGAVPWLLATLIPPVLLAACSAMPPAVDSTAYVPLALAPASFSGVRDQRANFRDLFCREPDSGEEAPADACALALRRFRDEGVADRHIEPASLPRAGYRVALALGVGWNCMRDVIDEDALPLAALAEAGYDTLLLETEGLSGSERNADIIAAELEDSLAADKTLILIGYSKGATDLLLALDRHPALAARTAAFVAVAGTIGGSPIAAGTGDDALGILRLSPFGDCGRGDRRAMASLLPPLRQAWLQDHLPLPVPSYSLVTAPDPDRVSPALRSSYKVLGAVHPLNDGALLHWDQLLPGSTLLGYANADHWAVTIPIDLHDIPLADLLVTNGYPRGQLWRAIVDFVVADLEARGPQAELL